MVFLTGNTRDFGQTQGAAPTGLSRNPMFVHLRADLWIWSDTGIRATTGVRADTGVCPYRMCECMTTPVVTRVHQSHVSVCA